MSSTTQLSIGQQWQNARKDRAAGAGSLLQDISGKIDGSSYTIQFGDTIEEIVRSLQKQPGYKGSGNIAEDIKALSAANGISNPNLIQSGKKLDISSLVSGGAPAAKATPANQPLNAQGAGTIQQAPGQSQLIEQFLQFQIQQQRQQMNQNPFGFNSGAGTVGLQNQTAPGFNPADPLGLLSGFGMDGGFGRASALAGINPFDARSLAGLLALSGFPQR